MSTTTYFLWRPYVELCSTFNIKTMPKIRLLLGNTKRGLNIGIDR